MKFKAAAVAVIAACTIFVPANSPAHAEQADVDATFCDPVYGVGSPEVEICGGATATEPAVRLDPPVVMPPDAYQEFPSCKEAVDYLFYGRWDYSRALHVVYRESRYDPTAVSRTGAKGCAQLTGGLLNFLGGPWYDPYWNVLAMRRAVDSPAWGWCHWDIVNYCRPGGAF